MNERQLKILDLLETVRIYSQAELKRKLKDKMGLETTQSTISRDLKSLGAIRVADESGRKYFKVARQYQPSKRNAKIFRDTVISIDSAGNILVIRTTVGAASAAAAVIDRFEIADLVGTIAGDDTIFLLIRHEESLEMCKRNLENILKAGE